MRRAKLFCECSIDSGRKHHRSQYSDQKERWDCLNTHGKILIQNLKSVLYNIEEQAKVYVHIHLHTHTHIQGIS